MKSLENLCAGGLPEAHSNHARQVAAAFSFDKSVDIVTRHLRKAALYNPTKDHNLLPFILLIRGRRIEQILKYLYSRFYRPTRNGD